MLRAIALALVFAALGAGVLCGKGGVAMAADKLPEQDVRLTEVHSLNTHYVFHPFSSKEEWLRFARELRTHILVSTGLWPMPERTPLNAKIYDRIERGDYSIEKVYFESYPGFFCTGNLYRPLGKKGPFPGIINPHGHHKDGRFAHDEKKSVPGRCINFAKRGIVAFAYDMIGYNDSLQLKHREFFGPREDIWGLSAMGLQLWNSIRAIDFLQTLPDVDPERIGCTGASGGGTQTFMVTAVDDRIKVAAPVCMVSAYMQGGCLCENAPNLRIWAFNVHIAALAAPRPLLLVAATGDWTSHTMEEEYPAIRSVYALFGAEEKVHAVLFDAPHNYNKQSREAVYPWFGKWLLGIDDPAQFKELPFQPEPREKLLNFPNGKLPPNAKTREQLTEYLIAAAQKQLEQFKPKDETSLARFREVYGTALRHCLNVELPARGAVLCETAASAEAQGVLGEKVYIGRRGKGDRVPALLFRRAAAKPPLSAALIVHPEGKGALAQGDGLRPGGFVARALERVDVVLTLDCFLVGESQAPPSRAEEIKKIKYFTTYNRTDLDNRVQDILTGLAFLRDTAGVRRVSLVGLGEAGLWALLARAFAPFVEQAIIDADQFDATDDQSFIAKLYAPGIRRAGDVRTAGALAAPGKLFLHNAGSRFPVEWIADVFRAVGAQGNLRVRHTKASEETILAAL